MTETFGTFDAIDLRSSQLAKSAGHDWGKRKRERSYDFQS